MSFINETIHPLAGDLSAIILRANKAFDDEGDISQCFYDELETWRKCGDWTDEKTADLYARVEDIEGGLNVPAYASRLSKCLWMNEREYPR